MKSIKLNDLELQVNQALSEIGKITQECGKTEDVLATVEVVATINFQNLETLSTETQERLTEFQMRRCVYNGDGCSCS